MLTLARPMIPNHQSSSIILNPHYVTKLPTSDKAQEEHGPMNPGEVRSSRVRMVGRAAGVADATTD